MINIITIVILLNILSFVLSALRAIILGKVSQWISMAIQIVYIALFSLTGNHQATIIVAISLVLLIYRMILEKPEHSTKLVLGIFTILYLVAGGIPMLLGSSLWGIVLIIGNWLFLLNVHLSVRREFLSKISLGGFSLGWVIFNFIITHQPGPLLSAILSMILAFVAAVREKKQTSKNTN
ncbi:MAG: hypothetical protein FWC79_00810 [Oscillospiraceae bacterium]|nr:hypothetical protein [Oscillospiraceae bacterium]